MLSEAQVEWKSRYHVSVNAKNFDHRFSVIEQFLKDFTVSDARLPQYVHRPFLTNLLDKFDIPYKPAEQKAVLWQKIVEHIANGFPTPSRTTPAKNSRKKKGRKATVHPKNQRRYVPVDLEDVNDDDDETQTAQNTDGSTRCNDTITALENLLLQYHKLQKNPKQSKVEATRVKTVANHSAFPTTSHIDQEGVESETESDYSEKKTSIEDDDDDESDGGVDRMELLDVDSERFFTDVESDYTDSDLDSNQTTDELRLDSETDDDTHSSRSNNSSENKHNNTHNTTISKQVKNDEQIEEKFQTPLNLTFEAIVNDILRRKTTREAFTSEVAKNVKNHLAIEVYPVLLAHSHRFIGIIQHPALVDVFNVHVRDIWRQCISAFESPDDREAFASQELVSMFSLFRFELGDIKLFIDGLRLWFPQTLRKKVIAKWKERWTDGDNRGNNAHDASSDSSSKKIANQKAQKLILTELSKMIDAIDNFENHDSPLTLDEIVNDVKSLQKRFSQHYGVTIDRDVLLDFAEQVFPDKEQRTDFVIKML